MARTVADAVAVFDVIVGYDPADPVTEAAQDRAAVRFADHLDTNGLEGARIGALRQLSDREGADPAVLERFAEALDDLRAAGATVVDPVEVPELDTISGSLWCGRFQWDIEAYLATLGPDAPVRTLEEIIQGRQTHPTVRGRLNNFLGFEGPPESNPQCQEADRNVPILQAGVRRVLEEHELDALVFPTWSNPPRLIGDLNTPDGNNSPQLSPPTGFPAITVPMGYVADPGTVHEASPGLPVGLQFFGDAWTEARLIELAYAYEQATGHRRPPGTTP